MAAKFLEVAVYLTAIDRMSATIMSATSKSASGFNILANSKQRADSALQSSLVMGAGALAGIAVVEKFANAFGDAQEAQLNLRTAMLGPNGLLNESTFSKIKEFSVLMSGKYAGSQQDYIEMIRVMKENRLEPSDILGGIGESVAELSELFNIKPSTIGLFASRMKNDMKVPVQEMEKMVDLLARLNKVGVGGDSQNGSVVVSELTELFSKAGLGATNLQMTGVKHAKDLGVLGSMYIAKGIDAATVGTTFRRIFDNIGDPGKLKKMNEEAAKFGKHLAFFDKAGKFAGIDNFVAQLSTIRNLNPSQISSILDEFGSKQGMGGSVMKNIAAYGLEDYLEFQKRVSDQSDIHIKVHEIQKGYNQQSRIAHSNIDNLSSKIGESYNPAMVESAKLIAMVSKITGEWVDRNQVLVAGLVKVGFAVTGLMIAGAAYKALSAAWLYSMAPWANLLKAINFGLYAIRFTVVTSLIPAIKSLGAVLMATGIGEMIIAIGALVTVMYVMYQNWDKICKSMRESWQGVKDMFNEDIPKVWDYQVHGIKAPDSKAALDNVNRVMGRNKIEPITNKSGQRVFNYSTTVNITGDKQSDKFEKALREHKNDISRMFKGHNVDELRRKF